MKKFRHYLFVVFTFSAVACSPEQLCHWLAKKLSTKIRMRSNDSKL